MQNNVYSNIHILIWRRQTCFYRYEQKIKHFQNFIMGYNIIWKCEAMTSTYTFEYIYCSRQCKTLQFHVFPNFSSDFHQIFTVLLENLCSFYWINQNLDWISPLMLTWETCGWVDSCSSWAHWCCSRQCACWPRGAELRWKTWGRWVLGSPVWNEQGQRYAFHYWGCCAGV